TPRLRGRIFITITWSSRPTGRSKNGCSPRSRDAERRGRHSHAERGNEMTPSFPRSAWECLPDAPRPERRGTNAGSLPGTQLMKAHPALRRWLAAGTTVAVFGLVLALAIGSARPPAAGPAPGKADGHSWALFGGSISRNMVNTFEK